MDDLAFGQSKLKIHRYGELLRTLLVDQLASIDDGCHVRTTNDRNGHDAFVLAVQANRAARP